MDFIPTAWFITSLIIFGLLMYVYQPIITFLSDIMNINSGTSVWAEAMFFFWAVLALINLFGSGIKMVMAYQKRGG